MPDLTATVFPDEAYVLLQADWAGTVYRNSFSVDSVSGWPAADTGQTHTVISGAAGDYTVNNGLGHISHAATATTKLITAAGVGILDVEFSGVLISTGVPAGGNLQINITVRYVDANNFVDVRVFLNTTGTVTANIRQLIGGVSTVGSTATLPGLVSAGVYLWRLRVVGSSCMFKMWNINTPDPGFWPVTFTTTWLTAGTVGVGSFVPGGATTPLPIVFSFDNLLAVDASLTGSDCAIVTRRNTVTGEVVTLRPYIFYDEDGALILECGQGLWWDTEPPLNVELEYCTTACDAPAVRTANPTFESGVTGWTLFGFGSTFTQDCTVAKAGACSGRITPNGTDFELTLFQTGFPLTAGLETVLSTWVRSSQGWNGVRLTLEVVYTDFTSEEISTPVEILDDGEWRYLSVTFTPRMTVSSAVFSFIISGTPANTNLFNVDELQVAQMVDVTATDCVTVTVEGDDVWLKSPLHPCDDVQIGLCSPMFDDCVEDSRVSYVGTSDDEYSPNSVLLSPANRRHPIPESRVRRDAAATLRLLAHDCEAKDAVLAINEPGDVLLFQAPADYCIPDRYISVGVVSETRFSVDQRQDFRLMTLPYTTVARPEGPMDGPCGARIEDLCDIYGSWAAMGMAGLTWTDLLLGLASPAGPGQPEPPEGARDWDDVEAEFTDWDDVEAGGTRDWDELRDGL